MKPRTVLLVGLSVSLALGAMPSVHGHVLAAPRLQKKPVNDAAEARKLATQVFAAGNDAARYRAVLSVMKALRLRVYSAKGKLVVRGSGKAGQQLAQYDFELQGIASRLGADQGLALPQFVAAIRPEITNNGTPLDTTVR